MVGLFFSRLFFSSLSRESPQTAAVRQSPRKSPRKLQSSFEDLMRYALMDVSSEQETTSAPSSQSQVEQISSSLSDSIAHQSMSLPQSAMKKKRTRERPESLGDATGDDIPADLSEFVNLFKKGSKKIPKPIKRLSKWYVENRDKMWIMRTEDGHLELTYDRPQLIRKMANSAENSGENKMELARKTVQNFERCLNSVKPKLIVLESTHGKDLKRVGFFEPVAIFGSARSVIPRKVERQEHRSRDKRNSSAFASRPTKRRTLSDEFDQ